MTDKHQLKQLKEMLSRNNHERLSPFRDPKKWKSMSSEERELLAKLFLREGEALLKKGDKEALKNFDLAAKAAPKNPKVLFRKGVAYSSLKSNVSCLKSSCRAFEKATRLEPKYFDAWFRWARALIMLGDLSQDSKRLSEADEKFKLAEPLLNAQEREVRANFYWRWGKTWAMQARSSGEACDIYHALNKYKMAADRGMEEAKFWNEYGDILGEQVTLLGRYDLLYEVVELYRKAVRSDPKNFYGWMNLGCTFTRLYEMRAHEELFELADKAFAQAAEVAENAHLWLFWGQLLLNAGKLNRNMEYLKASAEKFANADKCEEDHPFILARWGEALMYWGAGAELYEQLREAEAKLTKSLEADPKSTDAWYLYGRCLTEIGRYFSDADHFMQAIAQYAHALKLEPLFPPLHYGMALAYSDLSEQTGDLDHLSRALSHFSELAESASDDLPAQFWLDWGVACLKYGDISRQKQYLEAAVEKFERAILQLGDNLEGNSMLVDALYSYACVHDSLGDYHDEPSYYEKAIQLFAKVLSADPGFFQARFNLALSLVHLGEMMSDLECLNKACEQFAVLAEEDPEEEAIWNEWAVTLLHLGQLTEDPSQPERSDYYYSEAESKLCQALALGSLPALYNMACYYSLIDNPQAAMHFLERSFASGALPPLDDIMHDEWLSALRQTEEFRRFISGLMRKSAH